MMTASVKQFTPGRMLANVSGSFGAAQANWGFSVDDLTRYAQRIGGHAADQALLMGGMVLGVGKKGLEAVEGLATLAGDVVGTGGYLALKLAGADRMADYMFGGNYKRMVALKDATMKFFTEKSIGEMAYDIFAKPLADGFTRSRDALVKADQIRAKNPEEYSLKRAEAYLDAGMEVGQFGVDVALAILSVTGAGAAAKSLFNVGTAVGRSVAAGFATMGRVGSLTAAIEGLAGRFTASVESLGARLSSSGAAVEGRAGAQAAASTGESTATAAGRARIGERRISPELYDELRGQTPTAAARDAVNRGKTFPHADEALPGFEVTQRLQADHIVSMDRITRMEGFEELTKAQQLEVLNNSENLIGLSRSANASKGAKTFEEWTEHIKTGTLVDASFRERMIQMERTLERTLQAQIDALRRGR